MTTQVTPDFPYAGPKGSSVAAFFAFLAFHLFLLMNLAGHDVQAQSIPAEITVQARVNTGAVTGDADDPAIWIHPTDPALSLVIGTDKIGYFIVVWDMNGQELQRIAIARTPNNGDVRYGMMVGGAAVDIYVVGAQDPSRLVVFKIDPNTRTLTDISAPNATLMPQVKEPYGICLYRRVRDGAMFAFANSNGGVMGVLNQYRLLDDGTGRVKIVFVRSFGGSVNGLHSEGMVADDELGYVYISEEDCCIHKFYADPDMGDAQLAAFAYGDGIAPDREGLGIYGCADGTGYLAVVSQGNKRVMLYRREGDPGNPHSHTLVTTIFTPNIGNTDGIDITSHPAGPNFPHGFLVKHNSLPKNFGLIAWEDIAKNYLTTCSIMAEFAAEMTSGSEALVGCAPVTVAFSDRSSGPVTAWNWDFGDGGTSTEVNPSHTYTTAGAFTVTLTVTNASGYSTTKTRTNYVSIGLSPIAAFTATPTSGYRPFSVTFTDQSSGGTPDSWLWDFGDGNTSTEQNPTHEYTAPGNYTISLTVSNSCGTHTETKPDHVTATVPVTTDFSADTTMGCQPLTVQFTDHSIGAATTWQWDFGDGTTSTEQHPLHTYSQAGVYTVSLTASLPGGTDTKTKTDYITVKQLSTVGFVATPTTANVPALVSFTNQSTGAPTAWAWDFGDGATSTEQNPTHQYAVPGTYAVSLTLTSACDTLTEAKPQYIVVVDTVSAAFVANIAATSQSLVGQTGKNIGKPLNSSVAHLTSEAPLSGCAPLTVQFTDVSTGPIASWLWDFGDGTTSTEQNPVHMYTAAGKYTIKLTVTNSLGYSSMETKDNHISIGASPTVEFSAASTSGSNPLTVVFTDQSTTIPSATAWLWDFGDDSTSTAQNPTHEYKLPGDYTVQLTVTNACGSITATKTAYIHVEPCTPPAPLFSTSTASGSVPLTVNFTDQSTGAPLLWNWDFGDGTTSTEQNPTHQYAAAGTYSVSLTAGSACDTLTAIKSNYIIVIDTVSAEFAADVTSGCAPVAVQFTDQSTGPINSWLWDFGDGVTSTEQNPSHSYTAAGAYTVKLTVTNSAGYTSTKTKEAYLAITALPAVDFNATPITGSTPLTVVFTDQSTAIPNASAWRWDFGDGNTSTEPNPTHVYQAANDYTVKLTVTNACGEASATKTDYIQVLPCTPPAPSFNGASTSGNVPLTVSFTDQSIPQSGTFWNWDFGDGAASTEQNPTHQYAVAGTYSVSLTVGSDCDTLTATKSDYIVVIDTVSAEFAADLTSGCAPVAVQFTDQSTGPVTSWLWDFGDGATSTEQNPAHTYAAAGNYTVKLIVTNAADWNSSKTKSNYIALQAKPIAAFVGTPTSGNAPFTVTFTDQSTGTPSPSSWLWDFGDGNTSTEQNPMYTYSAAGDYTVQLTATNACGNHTAIQTNYVQVNPCSPPAAAFSASTTSGNAPLLVNFIDQSTGDPTSWNWDFGDGTSSAKQHPTRQYSVAGTYTVTLTVASSCNSDTATKVNYITVNSVPAGNLARGKLATASSTASPYAAGRAVDGNATTFWRSGSVSGSAPNTWLRVDLGAAYSLSRGVVTWKENYFARVYRLQISNTGGSNDNEWTTVYTNNSGKAGTQDVTFSSPFAARYFRIRMDKNNKGNNQIFELECYGGGASCTPPVADFSAASTSGNSPLTVVFADQSTGSPTSWSWNFGDGSTSTQQNPSHTYNAVGDYTITLTATGACGSSSATKVNYIHVGTCLPPAVDFSASITSGNAPLTVNFTDQSTGGPTAWNWNFGDGSSSTQPNPSHTYSVAGNYTVTLTATGACGSSSAIKENYLTVNNSAPPATGNLALNKLATASSTASPYSANLAVDGNATTYWRSGSVSGSAPNTWLRVDLGAAYSLSRGVVTWKENYFATVYRLQISNTGGANDNEWTTVYTNNSGKAGAQDMTFTSPFAARYFRIRMDKNNKGNNQIYEFECYGGVAKSNSGGEGNVTETAPEDYALEQNYPNPFGSGAPSRRAGNSSTRIAFSVKQAGEVELAIYNLHGQEIRTLASGKYASGRYAITWDGKDKHGQFVPSGVYLYKLRVNGFAQTRKMTLMK